MWTFCQTSEHSDLLEGLDFLGQTAVRLFQLRLSSRNKWPNARTLAVEHGFDESTIRTLLGDHEIRALLLSHGFNIMEDRVAGAFDKGLATTGDQILPPALPVTHDCLHQFVADLKRVRTAQFYKKRTREMTNREAAYGVNGLPSRPARRAHQLSTQT